MAMRLNEVHPALTHYPLAFLPAAVGLDVAARFTDRDDLYRVGAIAMPMAAVCAAFTGASGLMAERQVEVVDDEAGSMLSTHRNLNIAAVAATSAMAVHRARNHRPGWGYLATGIGVCASLAYSSYLGGRMVYAKGMGVKRAGGLQPEQAPKLVPGNMLSALGLAARQIGQTVRTLFQRVIPPDLEFGPEPDNLQKGIEADNASAGALPLGSSNRPMS